MMSSDWQPGDLALKVCPGAYPGRWDVKPPRLRNGMYYVVREVFAGIGSNGPWTALVIDGPPSTWRRGAWNARGFRKIPPLTDEEREQFTADLNEPVKETACG